MKNIWRKIERVPFLCVYVFSVCMRVCREKEHQFENGTDAVV